MKFKILRRDAFIPDAGQEIAYLKVDNWNDYSFVTMFELALFDETGSYHRIGSVKIGFVGQTENQSTHSALEQVFDALPQNFFSVGAGLEYYSNIRTHLSLDFGNNLLSRLRDVAFEEESLKLALEERVFSTSLLRSSSVASIRGQYRRILRGEIVLTDFNFTYKRPREERMAPVNLKFEVKAGSKPSTNIHAIIGRNGIGKTTLLNGMVGAITKTANHDGNFFENTWIGEKRIDEEYFSSLISVAFSAFDPFTPPANQPDRAKGTCYYYVGLKYPNGQEGRPIKQLEQLYDEFQEALAFCFSDEARKSRWITAIDTLESDENFSQMALKDLADLQDAELTNSSRSRIERMSSGHVIVILIITMLVALVEEKTIVLIDEPESHLHPPLLSAFIRALSNLLHSRNGISIIATHSPVVLQEIPRSCVWKIYRNGLELSCARPELETFGENVGTLTRDVFGLEVTKSGFHTVLATEVAKGLSFEEIVFELEGNLGFEAQAVLKAMISSRDRARDQ